MGFQCFIHQMKGILFLCMLIYLILRKNTRAKKYKWKCFFFLLFLIVHISSNNVIGSLTLCIHVGNIHVEGTVSQIFFPYHSFYFMSKNGQLFILFLNIFFLHFIKKRTRTYIKNLRHISLHSNVFNTYVKFKVWVMHNQRDIDVQK